MSDFTTQDWIWVMNASMLMFCMLDGTIKGRDKLLEFIEKGELENSFKVYLTYVMLNVMLITALYYFFLIWTPPVFALTVLLFETAIKIYQNHTNTKSLTDYDE